MLALLLTDLAQGQPYCASGHAREMNIVPIAVPQFLSWRNGYALGKPEKIYCNKAMKDPLKKAFACIKERKLTQFLHSYDGCYCYRNKVRRNPKPELSNHAYGTAIDINANTNGYGRTPQMNPRVVRCFKENGFTWGGDWRVPDGMHFQLKNSPMRSRR